LGYPEREIAMKMFGQVALAAFSGVVLWKMLGMFMLSMAGMVLKFVLIMAVGYTVLTLFKRYRTNGEAADEG
jgi:hypothetical protein